MKNIMGKDEARLGIKKTEDTVVWPDIGKRVLSLTSLHPMMNLPSLILMKM